MATYDRTITGGGTVGHPGNLPRPYVITSPVYDAVDNTSLAGDDVVKLIDLPADSMVIGGTLEVLEASGNIVTSADSVQVTILDSGSSGTTALRFRVHAVICDISVNPVESATVSTGT